MSAFGLDLHAWLWLFSAIISVESNGDSSAVGDGGKAVGCMQIHPCVIEDVNRIYNKDYRLSESTITEQLVRPQPLKPLQEFGMVAPMVGRNHQPINIGLKSKKL